MSSTLCVLYNEHALIFIIGIKEMEIHLPIYICVHTYTHTIFKMFAGKCLLCMGLKIVYTKIKYILILFFPELSEVPLYLKSCYIGYCISLTVTTLLLIVVVCGQKD